MQAGPAPVAKVSPSDQFIEIHYCCSKGLAGGGGGGSTPHLLLMQESAVLVVQAAVEDLAGLPA